MLTLQITIHIILHDSCVILSITMSTASTVLIFLQQGVNMTTTTIKYETITEPTSRNNNGNGSQIEEDNSFTAAAILLAAIILTVVCLALFYSCVQK